MIIFTIMVDGLYLWNLTKVSVLRFTASDQDAPLKYIESDGGSGLLFAARVSCVVLVGISFVDVLDVCHNDKDLLFHKRAQMQ